MFYEKKEFFSFLLARAWIRRPSSLYLFYLNLVVVVIFSTLTVTIVTSTRGSALHDVVASLLVTIVSLGHDNCWDNN